MNEDHKERVTLDPEEIARLDVEALFHSYFDADTEDLTWRNQVSYSMDYIIENSKYTHRMNKELSKLLQKYTKLHDSFGKELNKICADMLGKIDVSKLQANESRLVSGLCSRLMSLGTEHELHAEFVTTRVTRPLVAMLAEHDSLSKAASVSCKKSFNDIKGLKSELSKTKQKAIRAIEVLNSEADNDPKAPSVRNLLRATMKIETADPNTAAYQACQQYEKETHQCQNAIDDIVTNVHPKLIDQLEYMETYRSANFHLLLQRFEVGIVPLALRYRSVSNVKEQDEIHNEIAEDLKGCMNSILLKQSVTEPFFHVSYDLSVFVSDLKHKLDPHVRREFGIGVFENVSCLELMQKQKDEYPQYEIPLLFLRQRAMFRYLGGFETEGIFRMSPHAQDLDRFVEQLKDDDYTLTTKDPHVVAASIKQWLRDMEEPLIPFDRHEECLLLVNSMGEENDSIALNLIERLMETIPRHNRNLIHAITGLVRELTLPVHSQITKMTIGSIAIVFAPGILRCENRDPAVLMNNSKNEIAFTEFLFEHLVVDESVLHPECDGDIIYPDDKDFEAKIDD